MSAKPAKEARTLQAGPAAAATARSLVRAWLTQRAVDHRVRDDAELLVTELVTNAVVHARSDSIQLSISEPRPDVLRVDVEDGSPEPPVQSPPSTLDADRGRGMWLVERLAERWGWDPLRTGKRVWFEMRQDAFQQQ